MSKIRYAAAMLAAGGAAGAAANAHAVTVVTLDLPPSTTLTEYITLTGSGGSVSTTPSAGAQFDFGPNYPSKATLFGSTTGLEGGIDSGWPNSSTVFTANDTYEADFFGEIVAKGPTDLQVEFASGGTEYWGLAYFAENGELENINFEAMGTPEPETWALLLAGLGLAGGALRGARRRRQAIAA